MIENRVKLRLLLIKEKALAQINEFKVSYMLQSCRFREFMLNFVYIRPRTRLLMQRWSSGYRTAINMKWTGKFTCGLVYPSQYCPCIHCTMIDHRSVSTLSEVLRQAIENEEKLINELSLPGAKLEIKQVNNTHSHKYCTK